ncbi:hypothetical protein FA13DRAFT_1733290 [Coprinellus micaceus]|uniref:Uncharacterized protein n=1 Tax=Coprinellus micaceus TaxID=71717 RepID=A0A4Y7T9N3_COPMI|nr:hypothetical protein FA13DRAFT_1733290 [Coprinellus micaceus]
MFNTTEIAYPILPSQRPQRAARATGQNLPKGSLGGSQLRKASRLYLEDLLRWYFRSNARGWVDDAQQ